MSSDELRVTVRYGDLEAEFSGSPQAVYREVISFIEKALPAYSLAKKISFDLDTQELLESLGHLLAYSDEHGLFFTFSLRELKSVSDAILFQALRKHLEHKLGKVESPSITSAELEGGLSAKKKTILNNLTKLVQGELLKRLDRGDYAITPLGIKYLIDKYGKRQAEEGD